MPRRLQDLDPEERLSKDQEYDTLPIGTQVARDFLDVHKGGLTYRLRIHCDRYGLGDPKKKLIPQKWLIQPNSLEMLG